MSLRLAISRTLGMARASRLTSPPRCALSGKHDMPVGDTANVTPATEVVGLPRNSNAGAKIAGGLLVGTTAGLWGWSTFRARDSAMWTVSGKAV
ncbi:hypothetical protein MMPV_005378 [Pyropia vietnamensis]